MFDTIDCQKLFFSLSQKRKERFFLNGFFIDLEKIIEPPRLILSTILFQKDFLPPVIFLWECDSQKKRNLFPYLQVDAKEMRVSLIQKVPLFLPQQLEHLVPQFLFVATRWSSLIQKIT